MFFLGRNFVFCRDNAHSNDHIVSLLYDCLIMFSWFDSSRSLMEQGVTENSVVQLRYKFYTFYDINQKVRTTFLFWVYWCRHFVEWVGRRTCEQQVANSTPGLPLLG